jgi:hypothetical protein
MFFKEKSIPVISNLTHPVPGHVERGKLPIGIGLMLFPGEVRI